MAKTKETLELESQIYAATKKQGVFGCFEVTIGWFGNERVDYLTYDTKGTWRCYEIKSSKSDFYSKSKKTFCGHYNYFVMPKSVFEEVKEDIPPHVGVYLGNTSVKRAKRQDLGVDEQVLKDSMIRSMSREVEKSRKSKDISYVDSMNRLINYERKEKGRYRQQYYNLVREVEEKFGQGWRR